MPSGEAYVPTLSRGPKDVYSRQPLRGRQSRVELQGYMWQIYSLVAPTPDHSNPPGQHMLMHQHLEGLPPSLP